jgi:hypothetical protein
MPTMAIGAGFWLFEADMMAEEVWCGLQRCENGNEG